MIANFTVRINTTEQVNKHRPTHTQAHTLMYPAAGVCLCSVCVCVCVCVAGWCGSLSSSRGVCGLVSPDAPAGVSGCGQCELPAAQTTAQLRSTHGQLIPVSALSVCVCVCVCMRERVRDRPQQRRHGCSVAVNDSVVSSFLEKQHQ